MVQLPAVGSEVVHEAGNARSVQLAVFDQSLDVTVGHFSQANKEVEVEAASPLQKLQSPFEIHLVLAEGTWGQRTNLHVSADALYSVLVVFFMLRKSRGENVCVCVWGGVLGGGGGRGTESERERDLCNYLMYFCNIQPIFITPPPPPHPYSPAPLPPTPNQLPLGLVGGGGGGVGGTESEREIYVITWCIFVIFNQYLLPPHPHPTHILQPHYPPPPPPQPTPTGLVCSYCCCFSCITNQPPILECDFSYHH